MSERIEGKIAAILDKTTVVINRGSDDGIANNTVFYIYSKIGPFFDPDTNENLGTATRIWGQVEVTITEKKFCVARTLYRTSFNVLALQNLFGSTRIELPIDTSQITPFVENIKIGFPVISEEKRTNALKNPDIKQLSKPEESDDDTSST